jgi:NAD(P)H-nitrite reductase large subunit/rubredoxin
MADQAVKVWRCSVCGYIHRGDGPPEWCPVCGSPGSEFEPYTEAAPSVAATKIAHWGCPNCSYALMEQSPPAICPVCATPGDHFAPLETKDESLAGAAPGKQVVVVGGGIAGISAVESLRQASPETKITLISKEPHLPYYRLNLTRYVAGEITESELPIHPQNWYDENSIERLTASEVLSFSPENHEVELNNGEKVPFEKLILTVGAHPFIPPLAGANRDGVTSLRTIEDARMILELSRKGLSCVCVGGGLLGLETAGALARNGADVTLLESHEWLMPRQLDRKAGELLMRHVTGMGIKILTQVRTDQIVGDERVAGVLLENGKTVDADLVVVATGIRPNSYLARRAGLEVNQGIVVDNHLQSSHPDVLAAGDVAEHYGTLYGTWAPSQYQGTMAGLNALGLLTEFGGIPRSNTLKVLGLDLLSIGKVQPEDGSFRMVEKEDEEKYFRFVFHDSFLVGAILLGDTSIMVPLKKAIEGKTDFSNLLKLKPDTQDVINHLAGK